MSTRPHQPPQWRSACRLGGIVLVAALGLVLTGDPAAAAPVEEGTKQLKEVLENARTWIVGIAGVLVAVMVTIAGIRYLLGGGDPGETEKAKTALRAALIGLAIVLLAPAIVAIVTGILGVELAMRLTVLRLVADPLQALLEWVNEELFKATGNIRDWISVKALQYPDSWVAAGTPVQEGMFALVLTAYAGLVVVGGVVVMTHETFQTRYSVREIAPRLVIGIAAAWAAPIIIDKALDVTNAGVEALVGYDRTLVNEQGRELSEHYANLLDMVLGFSSVFDSQATIANVLMGIAQIAAVAIVFISSIVRKIVLIVCVMFAPAALACHALPFTEGVARLWWRIFGACLAVSLGQAALLRVWSYTAFDASGAYISYGEYNREIMVTIALVVLWAMWKLQAKVFTAAIGHPLRIPGARIVKGFAMGAAAGAGHRMFRNWRRNKSTKDPTPETKDDKPAASWRNSHGWKGEPDGTTRSIRVRTPRINTDAWKKTTAKPKELQPQARVADGPRAGRGDRRARLPILPKRRINPAPTTPTPQHGANKPPTPVETVGAGPGTPAPRRIIGPIPRPDAKRFTRARRRLYASQRRKYPQPKNRGESS